MIRPLAVVMTLAAALAFNATPAHTAAPSSQSLTGTYTVVHHDSTPDEYVPFLQVGHSLVRLHFATKPHYRPNTRMTVSGSFSGSAFDVSQATASGVAPAVGATGSHSVLIMRVYWVSPDSVTDTQAVNQIAGTDNAYYQENSYNQLSLSAAATGWLQIPTPSTCDDVGAIETSTYNAAVSAGYNPDAFDHDMIYISSNDCVGRSWGEIGGKWTWIQGSMNNYRTSHELGHNLGLRHSHSLQCSGVPLGSSCSMDEYGDIFDTMGYPWSGENGDNDFNASQKSELGWLGGRLQTVTASGTYVLPAYEAVGSGTRALQISTPNRTYFVENREPIGFDGDLPTGATLGALIHIRDANNGGSDLLDMRPQTSGMSDAALPPGASWTDPEGVFTITTSSDTSSGLTLSIRFGSTTPPPTTGVKYDDSAATYEGWKPVTDSTGTYRLTNVTNNTAQFAFSGTSVKWLTKKGPSMGKASVTIDGVAKGTFDLYASTLQSAAISFTGLTSAGHKLVVKVLGTKNASSTGTNVAVDGFTVGTATTTENGIKVIYQSWKGVNNTPSYGGTYRVSSTAGRTASFTFTGTSVDWITSTGPGWGKAEVYVDGVDKGTVDLYAATAKPQTLKTYAGLSSGSHTIMIKVLGTKNAASNSFAVQVDGFIVH